MPNGWWIDPAGAIAISLYIVARWLAIAKQQVGVAQELLHGWCFPPKKTLACLGYTVVLHGMAWTVLSSAITARYVLLLHAK